MLFQSFCIYLHIIESKFVSTRLFVEIILKNNIDRWYPNEYFQIQVDQDFSYNVPFHAYYLSSNLCGNPYDDQTQGIQFEVDHNGLTTYIYLTSTSDSNSEVFIGNQLLVNNLCFELSATNKISINCYLFSKYFQFHMDNICEDFITQENEQCDDVNDVCFICNYSCPLECQNCNLKFLKIYVKQILLCKIIRSTIYGDFIIAGLEQCEDFNSKQYDGCQLIIEFYIILILLITITVQIFVEMAF